MCCEKSTFMFVMKGSGGYVSFVAVGIWRFVGDHDFVVVVDHFLAMIFIYRDKGSCY